MSLSHSTKCVYIDSGIDSETGAVNPPIYQSAGFSHPDPNTLEKIFNGQAFGHVYSRISNPTIAELERRITYLESSFASVAFSSGLGAIFSVCLVLAQHGKNIVVSDSLFGGTRDLFEDTIPKLGLEVRFVDVSNSDGVDSVLDDQTCAVFVEIISNPKLVIPNIKQLKQLTSSLNIPLIVDATLTGSVGFFASLMALI